MSAKTLLNHLRHAGFVVTLAEGGLRTSPASYLTESQRAAIREHKAELVDLLHQEHIDDVAEYVNERAAVLEYDHQLSRAAAEREAVRRAVIRFRLVDDQGSGTAVGECSIDELLADLAAKYGSRLATCEVKP
ncbi:MAG: hypothetical protein PHT19_10420 [Methylococcus sp.]|nr:hypothetical protein [Methylococcus sp.]